jgi:hypothetical protein
MGGVSSSISHLAEPANQTAGRMESRLESSGDRSAEGSKPAADGLFQGLPVIRKNVISCKVMTRSRAFLDLSLETCACPFPGELIARVRQIKSGFKAR